MRLDNTIVVYTGFAMLSIVIFMNIYILNLTISDLRIASDLARNDTQKLFRVLGLEDKAGTAARTDYAWHFNTGQKLDMLQDDVNDIKNKLGLADNFTYAGPNR